MHRTTLLAGALLLLGTGSTLGQAANTPDNRAFDVRPTERGERQARHRRGDHKAMLLERFDADGDGRLNEKEREQAKAAMKARVQQRKAELEARLLPRFDDNGDGTLDHAEWAEVKKTIGPMMRHARERGERGDRMRGHRGDTRRMVIERFDEDGDGRFNENEKAAAKAYVEQKRAALLERFDTDGDGTLNRDERHAARSFHREQRRLDINRDGSVDAADLQTATDRLAGGERVPDLNRDGTTDAADLALLAERIRAFQP